MSNKQTRTDRVGEAITNKYGTYTIIEYNSFNDIKVLQDDGYVFKTSYQSFASGKISGNRFNDKDEKVGRTCITRQGFQVEIIKYKNGRCTVRFNDKYNTELSVIYKSFKDRTIKNPHYYYLADKFLVDKELAKENPMAYQKYRAMIDRCYGKQQYNNVVYKGCVIKYSIPVGYNISFATYDGENTATIQDSGWMSSQIGTFTCTHKFLYITIRRYNNNNITPAGAPDITIKDITNLDTTPTLDSEKSVMSDGVRKEFANYISGYRITDGNVLVADDSAVVTNMIPLSGSSNLTVNFVEPVTGGLCAFYNANKEFIDVYSLGTTSPKVFSPVLNTACYFRTTLKKSKLNECTVVQDNVVIWKASGIEFELSRLKEYINPLEKVLVNSRIFHECKQAWADKDNVYESWPFGGVFADGDDIVMIYNSRGHHLEKVDSDVIIRKKKTLSDWYYKATIIAHDSTYSYGNPVCCKMPNGDYFLIVCCTNSSFVEDTHYFKMMKSTDKGLTWTDLGFVQVNNENVEDECMMSLFCTSTGKLISFVGGLVNRKFIASDDGGVTWRYVGETTGSGTLEAGFLEISDGSVLAILRKNASYPALIKLNSALTSYEVLYDFGVFAFPAWYNPTSIVKMKDGNILLLGGSRYTDAQGNYILYESVLTESKLLNNSIVSRCILKYPAAVMNDWGYAQVACANDWNIYAYFYAGKISGQTSIFEMIGCPISD